MSEVILSPQRSEAIPIANIDPGKQEPEEELPSLTIGQTLHSWREANAALYAGMLAVGILMPGDESCLGMILHDLA